MSECINGASSEDCSVREDQWIYSEEEKQEKEFWKAMGRNEGYLSVECPNCGRVRVEHWSCGNLEKLEGDERVVDVIYAARETRCENCSLKKKE